MTVKTFISVGVGTVGGLVFGTLALLSMVPVFFVIFQYIHERIIPKKGGLCKNNDIDYCGHRYEIHSPSIICRLSFSCKVENSVNM